MFEEIGSVCRNQISKMNKRKCHHGFELDSKGNHIIPEEKSTAELIEEAQKLFQKPKTVPTEPPQTERDKELEKTAEQYNTYFKEMQEQGKLSPSWFPKTFFDREKKET